MDAYLNVSPGRPPRFAPGDFRRVTTRGWLDGAGALVVILFSLLAGPGGLRAEPRSAVGRIASPAAATELERFAARELQRYLYACTGDWFEVDEGKGGEARFRLHVVEQSGAAAPLGAGEYRIRSVEGDPAPQVEIAGGDALGVLYGVYRYAERLGARFYLHGDVLPDRPVPLPAGEWQEEGRPLFTVRGLLPFHDFSEGPDWWNRDDYLAVLGQMAKLRMNFIGLHTYPESQVGPEPTVWIGAPEDLDEQGRVRFAYPSSYHTTGRSGQTWWGYDPVATSAFVAGAAEVFERDDFGAEVMRGPSFAEQKTADAIAVFERTADLLGAAFREAGRLGILTCVGTETPLTVPKAVRARLAAQGRDPDDPAVVQALYRAMFRRIEQRYPADYYWLWTPENWTWEGNHPEHFEATARDIRAALGALEDLGHPMTLATCGWVLGPQHDRAALDRLLPPNSPMSAINSAVGHTPIERQFASLSDRPRWAIPWLENDGTITAPQLWAGRMRYDAVDARRLGCTGLIGIHWRSKILAPAIGALAAAAWDQSWIPDGFDDSPIPPLTASGATGGRALSLPVAVGMAERTAVTRSNRLGMPSYDLLVPNGDYVVRLGFSELDGAKPGERVFDVHLLGRPVLEQFDPATRSADDLVHTIDAVKVTDAHVLLEFVARVGEPSIAFIEIEGTTDVGRVPYAKRVNCGGPALGSYEADERPGRPRPTIDRTMPVADLYEDFATANFGPEVGPAVARILVEIEGVKLPLPNHWIDGPGDIKRNREPWAEVSRAYSFVDTWAALRPQVRGAAELDRFDQWFGQFHAMRLLAEIGCLAGALDREVEALEATDDPAAARERVRTAALPIRLRLAERWADLLRTTLAGASTLSELGTLANLEQRSRVHQHVLDQHDAALARWLGSPLPAAVHPSTNYRGPARIIVPTVRTAATDGEALRVKVLLVGEGGVTRPVLRWRWLGDSGYREQPLRHDARRVYVAELPPLDPAYPGIEYHIEARLGDVSARWPVTDHGRDQTVVRAAKVAAE